MAVEVKKQVRGKLADFCSEKGVDPDELILNYWQDILVTSSSSSTTTTSEDLTVAEVFEMISPILLDLCRDAGDDVERQILDLSESIFNLIAVRDSNPNPTSNQQNHQNHQNPLSSSSIVRSNRTGTLHSMEKNDGRRANRTVSLEHHFIGKLGTSVAVSLVDSEKLAKAEAKLRIKQEKKLAKDGLNQSSSSGAEGSEQPVHGEVDWMAWLMRVEGSSGVGSGSAEDNARDIKIDDFDIGYPGNSILKNATLSLANGRRYGLVGRNGEGKSTLLKALASREIPVPRNIRILLVEQEVIGDDTSAIDSVLKADGARSFLLEKEKELLAALHSDPAAAAGANNAADDGGVNEKLQLQLKMVYRKLEEIEADKAEAKASAILSGLGFSPSDQLRATKTFSGGWRMRLSLARSLLTQPDLLLLDEPTNMLDVPSVAWLERYLTTQWKNTLLVVSHDRFFLTSVTTDIIHLHHGLLDSYKGDYEVFVATKEERLRHQQKEYENQLQYRQHLQSFIDRWRYNAKRASQAQSKMKILEKLPDLRPVLIDAPVRFKFPDCERLTPPLLQMSDVSFRYGGNGAAEDGAENTNPWLLQNVHFDLTMESRIALVGANGCGKTTFLKVLIGQLESEKGYIFRHNRLKFAYFSQFFIDQLDLSVSAMQYLMRLFPTFPADHVRAQLGAMGLSGNLAMQIMGTLSGGQKSRVAFTMLALHHPHILIMDEPSNHLDMDSIDALADALEKFNGGVIVVSHDELFMNRVCREIWECRDGTVRRFEGSIREYKKKILSTSTMTSK